MPGWLATLLFVLVRVAALVLIVPGLSHHALPYRARALVMVLLVVPILCVIPPTGDQINISAIPPRLVHEAVVGLSLGLVPAALVWGLQLAVQTLQGMTGLACDVEAGPSMSSGSALYRFLMVTVLAVFFTSSGHRVVFQSVLDSFAWLPAGSYTPLDSTRDIVIDLLSASFALGVRAVSPIAVSLLVGLLALAALNRVVPQLGYFAVGMSMQTLIMLGALVLCLGTVAWVLENSFLAVPDSVRYAWQAALSEH